MHMDVYYLYEGCGKQRKRRVIMKRVTRKEIKQAIGWINKSGAVNNTDEKFVQLVSVCNKLRKPDMTAPGWDNPANYLDITLKEWEDKVYYHFNPKKLSNDKIINTRNIKDYDELEDDELWTPTGKDIILRGKEGILVDWFEGEPKNVVVPEETIPEGFFE